MIAALSNIQDAALQLAACGCPVFPVHSVDEQGRCSCGSPACSSPGKHPRAGHGVKDATTDSVQIHEWWEQWPDANIGLATGEVSGIIVLDVDPRHGGDRSLEMLEREYGDLPKTVSTRTGGGGRHIFFKIPNVPVSNRVGIEPGLDIRSSNGYVVVPPSTHASGNQYEWESGLSTSDTELAEMPEWLVEICCGTNKNSDEAERNLSDLIRTGVAEGQRNVTAARIAGYYIRRGDWYQKTLDELRAWNRRNKPPLSDDELERVVKSIWRREKRKQSRQKRVQGKHRGIDYNQFPLTDAGNAELFAACYGDRVRYDHKRKQWFIYDGAIWRPDLTGEVKRLAKDCARRRQEAALSIEGEEKRKKHIDWGIKSESEARIESALRLARAEPGIADNGESWDTDTKLLGVKNGILDLRTGELRKGRPEDRVTKMVPLNYDPLAKCPTWIQYLLTVLCDNTALKDYLQRLIGYTLSGETCEQILAILYGKGANGKSVLLNVLAFVLGPYAANTPFNTFELSGRNSIPADLAALQGVRLVTASEVNDGTRFNEARIKAITGQDEITARFMHQNFFTYQPQFTLWLAVNHLPIVRDSSTSFWRRVHVIPFNRTFTPQNMDKDLSRKLKKEASGILEWAVQGFLKWQKQGLQPPREVNCATRAYQCDSDTIQQFIDACCDQGSGLQVKARPLYERYRTWCDSEGISAPEMLSNRKFGEEMKQKYSFNKQGSILYSGIALRSDDTNS